MNQSLPQLQLSNGKAPLKVDLLHSKKAAMILRALNHKLRQQIVKLIDEQSLKLSLKQIDGAKKQFEAEKIIYEKALAERDRIQSENDKLGILSLDKIPMKKFQDDVDAATSSYARAWERWDFLRKQIQQSDVTLPEDDDTKTKKKLELLYKHLFF